MTKPIAAILMPNSAESLSIGKTLEEFGFNAVYFSQPQQFLGWLARSTTTGETPSDAALFCIWMDYAEGISETIVRDLQSSERWSPVPVAAFTQVQSDAAMLKFNYLGAEVFPQPADLDAFRAFVSQHTVAGVIHPDAAPVVFSLPDFVSRELSRAKRTTDPVSFIYVRLVDDEKRSLPGRTSGLWTEQLITSVKQSLRESDTVTLCAPSLICCILPMTDRENCAAVETRLHDALRKPLNTLSSSTYKRLYVVTASATAPNEAENWRELAFVLEERLTESLSRRLGDAA